MATKTIRGIVSAPQGATQREAVRAYLRTRGMARVRDLRAAGITAATVSRMEQAGELLRLGRGLYQLADAPLHPYQALAEAALRVPKGVICLTSALAFHDLTDQLPRKVWLAIGHKDWAPAGGNLRVVRMTDAHLKEGAETHTIGKIPVKVFGVARTIIDCFRHRRAVGLSVALEGLQEALRQRKVTAGAVARLADQHGIGAVVRPYLEALTANA